MKRVNLSILLVSLLFVGCGSVNTTAPTTTDRVEDSSEVLKNDNKDILNALNLARSVSRDCHDGKGIVPPAKPLTWNSELYASAYEHSSDMAQSNTFSHLGSGTESDITASNNGKGKSYFYDRIISNGYGNYSALGENIAGGQQTLDEVMKAWLASPSHCANIMNSNFEEVGVAVIVEEDSDFGIYWTQNFGSK